MKISRFEDLEVWKSALAVTRDIYLVTAAGDFSKDFGLRDQIRRAAVSISSNIVEGFEKNNNNELIRFLKIAKGSAGEVRNQLYIAQAVGYVSEAVFDKLKSELEGISAQIGGFIVYLEKKRSQDQFLKK